MKRISAILLLSVSILFLTACSNEQEKSQVQQHSDRIDSVSVIVTKKVNIPPITKTEKIITLKENTYNGELKAEDSDGDEISFVLVDAPKHGKVTLEKNGCYAYIPNKGYKGTDSFSYKAKDELSSSPKTVVNIMIEDSSAEVPSPAQSLNARDITTSKVTLCWEDDAQNRSAYLLYQNGKLHCELDKNRREATITNLKSDTAYTFTLKAKNRAGESRGKTITITTKEPTTIPQAPSELKILAQDDNSIRLGWKDNADNESAYEIFQDGKLLKTISTNCHCTIIKNIPKEKTTTFEVRAKNKIGSSEGAKLTVNSIKEPTKTPEENGTKTDQTSEINTSASKPKPTPTTEDNTTKPAPKPSQETNTTESNNSNSSPALRPKPTSENNTTSSSVPKPDHNTTTASKSTTGNNTTDANSTQETNTSTEKNNNKTTKQDTNTTTKAKHDDTNTSMGGRDTNGTTGGSNDGNETGGDDTNTTVRLNTLKLTVDDTTLNKDHNTTVTLTATYSDHTTKPLTNGIKWIVNPKNAVTIHGNTLTALNDTNVTVQAKVGTTLSNTVKLNIYWEVNGHRLPPEPDPKINNATLLGVDVNKNGVRDDVERWIYEKYKEYKICHKQSEGNYTLPDGSVVPVYNVHAKEICSKPIPYHPVVREVAMQGARAAQIIIQEPEKAQETLPVWNAALFCSFALRDFKDSQQRKLYTKYIFGDDFKKIQFNTVQRARAFGRFNFYLSGGVYFSPSHDVMLKECNKNVQKYLKELK